MATGALSTRLLCKSDCSTSSCRPVSSLGSNCYVMQFRRVVNADEESDDFIALTITQKWRGNANGFGKGRRATPMAMASRAPEPSTLNEVLYEVFRKDVLERVGEVGAQLSTVISTYKKRFSWSIFQPQQFTLSKRAKLRSGLRTVVDYLIQSTQPVLHSLDFHNSQKGLSKSFRNGDQAGRGSAVNAVNSNADTNSLESQVQCQFEAVTWRKRHISASVRIEAAQERVWKVLTDYARLAEFLPNLTRSEQIPCPHPGRTWLLQEGKQTPMYWQIEARVVLDLEELPDAKYGKELRFSMVDGDFKCYAGRWYLRPDVKSGTTILHYELNVTPRLLFPAAFVERIIMSDLSINLRAMAERAEDCSKFSRGATCTRDKQTIRDSSDAFSLVSLHMLQKIEESSTKTRIHSSAESSVQIALQLTVAEPVNLSQGSSAPVSLKVRTRMSNGDYSLGAIGSACKLGKSCAVDEVHLRRCDDLLENGGVHRRVVAAITVEAPAHHVWAVLTAYESLPEFISNLAICQVLTRKKNRVRLLQVGCKCLLYMVLHARVVLDLWERPPHEILFQQVEGDFDSFKGKWTLEPLGAQHTLVKYLVETKVHKDSFLAEALVGEVIYEDLPANLCALRDRVELILQDSKIGINEKLKNINNQDLQVPEEYSIAPGLTPLRDVSEDKPEVRCGRKVSPPKRKRPLVAGLQRDFNILEQEICKFIAGKGTEGVMPLRCELRKAGRVDLEKAIARNGGFGPVASKLNLSLAYKGRKPRGYWDNLQNIHKEILLFQKEHGNDRMYMPTRQSFERAGRYDLARSLEKWGGLREVARVLGLQVKKRQRTRTEQADLPPVQLLKVFDEDEADMKLPLKTALPLKSTKWVTMCRGARMDIMDQ